MFEGKKLNNNKNIKNNSELLNKVRVNEVWIKNTQKSLELSNNLKQFYHQQ